jgi:hypothetical protein
LTSAARRWGVNWSTKRIRLPCRAGLHGGTSTSEGRCPRTKTQAPQRQQLRCRHRPDDDIVSGREHSRLAAHPAAVRQHRHLWGGVQALRRKRPNAKNAVWTSAARRWSVNWSFTKRIRSPCCAGLHGGTLTSVGRCPGTKTREHQSQHRCRSQSERHSRPSSPTRFAVRSHSAPQIDFHLSPSPPLRCAQTESTPIVSPPLRSESAIRRPCIARSNDRKSPFTAERRPNWFANRPLPQTVAPTLTFANRPSPQTTAPNPQSAFRPWLALTFASRPSPQTPQRKNHVAPSSCVRKLQAAKRAPPFLGVQVFFPTRRR